MPSSISCTLLASSSPFSASDPNGLAYQEVKKEHEAAMISLKATKDELERAKSNEAAALAQKHQVPFAL